MAHIWLHVPCYMDHAPSLRFMEFGIMGYRVSGIRTEIPESEHGKLWHLDNWKRVEHLLPANVAFVAPHLSSLDSFRSDLDVLAPVLKNKRVWAQIGNEPQLTANETLFFRKDPLNTGFKDWTHMVSSMRMYTLALLDTHNVTPVLAPFGTYHGPDNGLQRILQRRAMSKYASALNEFDWPMGTALGANVYPNKLLTRGEEIEDSFSYNYRIATATAQIADLDLKIMECGLTNEQRDSCKIDTIISRVKNRVPCLWGSGAGDSYDFTKEYNNVNPIK